MAITLSIILLISFFLALRSMKDLQVPLQIKHLLAANKIKGTIVFLKDKIIHYH